MPRSRIANFLTSNLTSSWAMSLKLRDKHKVMLKYAPCNNR